MNRRKEKETEEKRRTLITNILLSYVNIPLMGKPENLYKIYDVFREDAEDFFGLDDSVVQYKINGIILLNSCDRKAIKKLKEELLMYEELKSISYPTDRYMPPDAYVSKIKFAKLLFKRTDYPVVEDVFKYQIHKEKYCPCTKGRSQVINAEFLKGPDRLKCYECDQQYFIYLLDAITKGKKLFDIHGIDRLVQYFSSTKRYKSSTEDNHIIMNQKDVMYESNYAFPAVFDGLFSNLLIECLAAPEYNHKRLKRCPYCGVFFFAKDTKRTVCYSSKCETKRDSANRKALRKNPSVTNKQSSI